MNFFCIHHKDAHERKYYIQKKIQEKYTVDINWITDFHPEEIVDKYHNPIMCKHSANQKNLNIAEISCFLKHRKAIQKISDSDDFGLVIEDDIKEPNFDFIETTKIFSSKMIENNCDILFLGSFSNCDLKNIDNKPYIVCNEKTLSRCCHAYIINNKSAYKLCNYLMNIIAPIDWQINYAINDLSLCSCWSYPHIYQRTEKKEILSLIR